MYTRCVNDSEYIEPRKLFNLVQFLMFDKGCKGYIIEEDTLELLIIRYGRDGLNEKIQDIFGEQNQGDEEKKVYYNEYIKKVNAIALEEHRRKKKKEDKSKSSISK